MTRQRFSPSAAQQPKPSWRRPQCWRPQGVGESWPLTPAILRLASNHYLTYPLFCLLFISSPVTKCRRGKLWLAVQSIVCTKAPSRQINLYISFLCAALHMLTCAFTTHSLALRNQSCCIVRLEPQVCSLSSDIWTSWMNPVIKGICPHIQFAALPINIITVCYVLWYYRKSHLCNLNVTH